MHTMPPAPQKPGKSGPPRLLIVAAGALLLVAAAFHPVGQADCPKSAVAAGGWLQPPTTTARRAVAETPAAVSLAAGSSSDGFEVPDPNFDWAAYLHNYPDLLQHPHNLNFTARNAWEHYTTVGQAEGRVPQKLTLRLRYHTGGQNKPGGLNNQILCHLTAFMMARELGAEVVLAPALKRTAFAVDGNSWIWEDTDTLLDVDKMVAYWGTRGLVVHKTPRLEGAAAEEYSRLVAADEPPTSVYGDNGCVTIQMPRPHKFDNNLASISQRARRKAVKAAEYVLKANGTIPACINVDTPRIFYRVPVSSSLNLAVSTFNEGFFFNRTLLNMATFIKRKMGWPFFGAHMRLENDASVWNGPDGEERVLNEYINVMGKANFTSSTTVYVASGLLFDGPSPEFDAVVKALESAGVAGRVDYKEKLVDKEVLQGLHSEQLALVDLLVLASSKVFVGHPWSTLSMLVEQLRICSGLGTSTIHYVTVLDETKEYLNIKMKDKFVRFAKGFTPK